MPVEPRPAATLLLLRDGAAGLEVLMLERHQAAFFSGALVFPGGRVDDEDRILARAYPVPGQAEEAVAFRIAAIRESWEEVGIMLARPRGEDRMIAASALAGLSRASRFSELIDKGAIVPAVDSLATFAHWITPERSPKRFDTLFFLALAPPDQQPVADGGEAVEAIWITPAAALADADAKRRRLVFATRLNLHRLQRSQTAAEALAAAARHPLTCITPEVYDAPGGGLRIRIPEGLGYDICDLPTADLWRG